LSVGEFFRAGLCGTTLPVSFGAWRSGGLESRNFQFCTNLSNSFLLFSKFMKKGNIKGCCG